MWVDQGRGSGQRDRPAELIASFSVASREALLSHPAILRFVAWAAKKRGRADASHFLQHKR